MKINNTDISVYYAKQHVVAVDHAEIKSKTTWSEGAITPAFKSGKLGPTKITVSLIVKGNGRYDIGRNVSDILASCLDVCELELDPLWDASMPHLFTGTLSTYKHQETALKKWHKLDMTFIGYWHGELQRFSGTKEVAVHNDGNIRSPVIFTLKTNSTTSKTIKGLGADIETYSGGDPVVNGITGIISNPNTDTVWELPTVAPGDSIVTCDGDDSAEMIIDVLPLYM